ncbi:MAG TPA: ribbon-helix-helix protein, CopG family [Opitutaceae bacterium]|nr:ribbon-helix-helix protein, CopG family [Opitutaceae bacterium]
MAKTVTTSVRLPVDLRRRLAKRAAALRVGRNRVIIDALEQYLKREARSEFETEARRQSLLATQLDPPDDGWERMVAEDMGNS